MRIVGMSQDMLDELQTYEPGKCEEVQYIFQDLDLISTSISRLSFIYNGFRAASADGELHPKELKAICKLGKKLGLTAEEIEQCRLLTEEEENLRRKRAKILFPEGFDNFLKHFTEQYL
ncbi:unnamed protein product [Rotaria sordida]|uniref:Co-chaperone DjlA N-terminal domain-containing protein n=1 Tax=Rotaria sordida TaxID=392033 RepID=A0A814NQM6_9BILA|nr:unnamed protein product [Rotaria sordida]CAF3972252.1 unnamed protein product [Rotaria sordida]